MHKPDEIEDEASGDGGAGAAVFPLIPPELGVSPLLLALLHAMVFIDGSTDEIVCPDAAGEAMEYLATYLQQVRGADLTRLQEDLKRLQEFAKRQGWSTEQQEFLKYFLANHGIGKRGA